MMTTGARAEEALLMAEINRIANGLQERRLRFEGKPDDLEKADRASMQSRLDSLWGRVRVVRYTGVEE